MLEAVTALLSVYRIPAVFLGAFLFGDSVIFTAAYMAGQLEWAPLPMFVTAFFGTAAADTMWFFLGAYLANRFRGTDFMRSKRERAGVLLRKLTGENPAYALIFIKFIYGSRIAMIVYVAARGLSFATFSVYNSIGIFVWLVVFFPIGYLAGRGVASNFPIVNAIEAAVIVLVASFVIMRLFTIWLTRNITK